MDGPKELPDLFRDFFEMAKGYLRQETIEPAKALGRMAGFGIGAGIAWSFAAIMLVVAGHRLILNVLPDDPSHQMWSGLGYLISGAVWLACGGFVAWLASR